MYLYLVLIGSFTDGEFSRVFSNVWQRLHDFASNSGWLIVLFASVVVCLYPAFCSLTEYLILLVVADKRGIAAPHFSFE